MLNSLVRRAAILVTILALVAGLQTGVTPMATGAPAAGMIGMAPDGGAGACKGCTPHKMTVADCFAACAAIAVVVDVTLAPVRHVGSSAWTWSNDPGRSHSCEPDTAPPRS